jgi:hypothetical protein
MVIFQANSRNYSAQRREFEIPNPLDPSVSQVRITLTRESWPLTPNDVLVSIGMDISYDDGATWGVLISSDIPGGIRLDRAGNPALTQIVGSNVLEIGNPNRRLRGVVTNVANLTTAITMEAF